MSSIKCKWVLQQFVTALSQETRQRQTWIEYANFEMYFVTAWSIYNTEGSLFQIQNTEAKAEITMMKSRWRHPQHRPSDPPPGRVPELKPVSQTTKWQSHLIHTGPNNFPPVSLRCERNSCKNTQNSVPEVDPLGPVTIEMSWWTKLNNLVCIQVR